MRGARDKALRQGMLPVVWAADNPQAILESYNVLFLREGVQMGGGAQHRRLQVSRKAVEEYLDVLEDLLWGFRLEVFAKRANCKPATHPKF